MFLQLFCFYYCRKYYRTVQGNHGYDGLH